MNKTNKRYIHYRTKLNNQKINIINYIKKN